MAEKKVAEKKKAAAAAEEGADDGSFMTEPTPTQFVEEARKPLDPEGTEEAKIVRTGDIAGGTSTTLKEEFRVVDEGKLSGDEDADMNTLSVLARTQGINQVGGDVVMGQDGKVIASVSDAEGEIPESAPKS